MVVAFIPSPEMIDAVDDWHQRQSADRISQALIPFLRERFGISNAEAINIVRHAARDEAENLHERIVAAITGQEV